MSSEHRLKIAYLCDMDPRLPWTYSGGNARIYNALQTHVGEVSVLSPSWGLAEPIRRLMHRMPTGINMRLRWRLHYLLAPIIARQVARQLKTQDFDVLLGVYSLQALADVKTPPQMVRAFTSDATQTSYKNSEIGAGFGSAFGPSRLLDGWVKRHETKTLNANDINFWPSDWQNDAAQKTYGLTGEQALVLPWGANIATPNKDDLKLDLPMEPEIHLLLVGRDWQAKGGPFVLEVLRALRNAGCDARLSVVGTTPPPHDLDPFVDVFPNLDKTQPQDLQTFENLFKTSHFMVQPSLESYGFAFCEASAFALPSLCLKRGGIPVWDGINGHALDPTSTAEDFAAIITSYKNDQAAYYALRRSSRDCFENKLNWAAWGDAVRRKLQDLVASRAG